MNVNSLNLEEISFQESKEINGGAHPGLVAILAACGVGLGVMVVGCIVGYGLYCAFNWAVTKK